MTTPQPPTIYWAAPLFTDAERAWNAECTAAIRSRLPGLRVLVPQEFCASHDQHHGSEAKPDFAAIFRDCRAGIDAANIMIAVLDGADADSGTAWEMGYAHARDLTIIGLRSDWRPAEDGGGNAMLTRSCTAICHHIDGVIDLLAQLLPASLPTAIGGHHV